MSVNEFSADNLLQDTYSIDDQSYKDEEESNSLSASSKIEDDVQYINFIQAIKDDNVEVVKSITLSFPSFINRIGPEGLSGIQYATLFSNTDSFKFLNEKAATINCFVEGIPLLHLSLSFSIFKHHRSKAIDFFKYLYENHQELRDQKDRLGRKIVHLIVQYDIEEALKIIIINKEDLFCKDFNGNCAINYIYQYKSLNVFKGLCFHFGIKQLYFMIREQNIKFIEGCFVFHCFQEIEFLLINNKDITNELIEEISNAKAFYPNSDEIINNCQLAIDYLNTLNENADSNNMNSIPNTIVPQENKILFQTSNNKTALVYNNKCIFHIKLPEDPVKRIKLRHEQIENSDRLSVLMQPPFGILLDDKMINSSSLIYNECERKAALVDILRCHDITYINKIKKQCETAQETPVLIDADTYINKNTFESIFNATGCVLEGVDIVMLKKSTNAFVLLRPPGHHAGYFGGVTPKSQNGPISNGFCIVNNICIGAAYCKYQYKEIIKKIAIVDFDVHHGNGTEEIVSLLAQKEMHSNFQSILGNIEIAKTVINPWLNYDDASDVLFISLHAYNEDNPQSFYPYSGSIETNTKKSNSIYPGGILNIPLTQNKKYSYEYRNIFRQKVIHRLHKFKPDIIFISAGFDGHEKENINAGLMCLNEFDYSFLTEQIQTVANKYCEGRIVSVLEGGYNVQSGIVSSFAQSVWIHVQALNSSINKARIQECLLTQLKRQREYEKDYENFKLTKNIDMQPRRSERIKQIVDEKDIPKDKEKNNECQINIQDLNKVFSYENEVQRKNELKLSNEQDEKMNQLENENNTNNNKEDFEEFEI